jgi:hypothetical protein
MDLLEFLNLKGTDLPSVVAGVEAAVGLHADDILLAAGSIVEGLGNSKSDIDLLLITSRDPASLPARDELGLVMGRCVVDLRILRTAWVDESVDRLHRWSQAPWQVTEPVTFTLDERALLHRLLHGRLLNNLGDVGAEQVAARMPSRAALARLKLQVARQAGRTIQVDMVGYRETGDCRSLVFAAQELLGHAVDALTAGYELTNPTAKWRHRMLDRIPPGWAHALMLRPTKLTASEQFWRLHRAPELPQEGLALAHAFRITTFARAVFAWAEGRLVNPAFAVPVPAAWPVVERQAHDVLLPCLDFDVDFVLGEDRVMIARLNEFGDPLELRPRELALVLLCDGATSVRESEAFLCGSGDDGVTPALRDHVLSRLAAAKLMIDPPRIP